MNSGTTHTCEFLVGTALAERITKVAQGGQFRCAVAFWSAVGVGEVFPAGVPANAKIVCDISMGSTSAEALIALGASNNPNLRHSVRMHAKVFISDEGLVVGSANASASALGDGDGPILNTEAGIFHPAGSTPWKSAAAWFDRLVDESSEVGDSEVEWARLIYRPKAPAVRPRKIRAGSLFDLVTAAPWRFAKVGFAFSSTTSTPEEKAEVRKEAKKSEADDASRIDKLDDEGIYVGWDKKDIKRWPEYFFSFWQPNLRLSVFGSRVEVRVVKSGSLLTSRDWRGLRSLCDVEIPTAAQISQVDATMALKLRNEDGGVFYGNGLELAARIAEIQAEEWL